ncbi:acyltransferase [Vibrio alginolyticus]|uniref:acyltransferase n=1 Tax=Vibrio alginolyticus TaxID=663 RepID=UPI001BD6D1EC|nr:acyltransferase [Vibrio alginolyticus]MBS9937891.1 acyltransferase [Vibrio alginolyticus]
MLNKIFKKIHNRFISDEEYARKIGVKIGKKCVISSRGFSSEPYLIEIGDNVRIANEVRFFTHGGLIPFRTPESDLDIFGKIKIGNSVHIGHGAYIMPGVTVGDRCIIGAGSVVAKSVPSGVVVAGNPAKIVSKVDDFLQRAKESDFSSKKLNYEQKKKLLLESCDDDRFIKKPYMKI